MARLGPPARSAGGRREREDMRPRPPSSLRLRGGKAGEALEGPLRGRGGRPGAAGRGMGWGEGLAQAVLALPPAPALPARSGKKARLAFGKRSCDIVENQGVAWSREAWA